MGNSRDIPADNEVHKAVPIARIESLQKGVNCTPIREVGLRNLGVVTSQLLKASLYGILALYGGVERNEEGSERRRWMRYKKGTKGIRKGLAIRWPGHASARNS